MEHGKKPTVEQRKEIVAAGLDPTQWLVTKNLDDRLVLVNSITGKGHIIERK